MSSRPCGQHRRRNGRSLAGSLAHPLVGGDADHGPSSASRPSLSVSDTTPHGALHQSRMRGHAFVLVDQHQLGRAAADVEDQRRAVAGLEQFVAAEHRQPRLLLRRDDVEHDAGLAQTRSMKSRPFSARRQASVATERDRRTLRRRSFSAQTEAPRPRGPSRRRKLCRSSQALAEPNDARKASMTMKPASLGRAISSRQLLVPRSIAP